jgi:hypothetical protein
MLELGLTRSRVLRVLWMAVAACLASCGGDAEAGGSGDLGSCGQLSGCGGDLIGTWTIDGACTDSFIQLMGSAVDKPECAGLIADTQSDATGTFTFTDTTMSATATLSIDVTARYTPACAMAIANGAAVDLAAACSSLDDQYMQMGTVSGAACSIVGANCDCILSFDQPLSTSNNYTASGGTITYAGDPDPVTFCVEGNKLKMGGRTGPASLVLTLSR